MLRTLGRAGLLTVLFGLVLSAASAQDPRIRHVQDDAGVFGRAAKQKADTIIESIARKHHKELFIETVESGPEDENARAKWSHDRFQNHKVDGVYLVFSKKPKFYRIEVGNKTRSEGYFTTDNVHHVEEIISKKPPADELLVRVADYVLDTMNQHHAKKNAPAQGQQQQHHDDKEAGVPAWVGWVCTILVVLVVIWVIFAIVRALTAPAAAPGYGGGGYGGGGYGGGGGGFFTGMLGGMFGAMAGMWIYNNMFGGHASYNSGGGVNWGGGDASTGAGGGYQGDTDTGASGGGDWGGGGAAAGGDDDKGGGFTDKSGGDDAGGGDWGGGGDDKGADAGGGDWGGGGGDWGGGGGGGGDFGGGGGGGDW
ncbi:MAG: TPM domain-containing protein [Planctomycetes bacterium]|nr:TPM domain-containing protein [Planctomycetota bacterium]